jgi:hypothetical protein
MVSAGGDQCPSCNAIMAIDQRYCLECGHRRGDPRLPFMDAVVFMDAVKQQGQPAPAPPLPPAAPKQGITANAAMIAGVGCLVLAIGVGVLIGRSGESGSSTAANATPQIIKVGSGEETASTSGSKEAGAAKKGKGGSGKTKNAAAQKAETGSSGASKAVEEVFQPSEDVELAPETVKKGGKCESGAGCEGGEFTGNFFGE